MLKFTTLIGTFFISISATNFNNQDNKNNDSKISNIFLCLKNSSKELKDTDYEFSHKIQKGDSIFNLFKIIRNNQNKGYFIVSKDDNLESYYIGNYDESIFVDTNLISPIFSDNNNNENLDRNINPAILKEDITYHIPPGYFNNLYKVTSSNYHHEELIDNCPYYYNHDYGPIFNGCAPTTGAMLISFYDRYSSLVDLIDGTLELNHEDDKNRVDNLIVELAKYMNTDKKGTSGKDTKSGYLHYFMDKGYPEYMPFELNSFEIYSYFISKYKNPTHLRIKHLNNKGEFEGHAVLGVGFANLREVGNFMITHYDMHNKNTGNHYVSDKYFVQSFYIGAK